MPSSSAATKPATSRLSRISTARQPVGLVFLLTGLSWLGEYVHNLFELPNLTVFSPENSIPALISLALFTVWWRSRFSPSRRTAALLLMGWASLHLVGGGIISVLPLPFLPFYPEQSLAHYAAHALYGIAQLPLIVLLIRQLRATAPGH